MLVLNRERNGEWVRLVGIEERCRRLEERERVRVEGRARHTDTQRETQKRLWLWAWSLLLIEPSVFGACVRGFGRCSCCCCRWSSGDFDGGGALVSAEALSSFMAPVYPSYPGRLLAACWSYYDANTLLTVWWWVFRKRPAFGPARRAPGKSSLPRRRSSIWRRETA